jgi:serine/threonine-protein kinase
MVEHDGVRDSADMGSPESGALAPTLSSRQVIDGRYRIERMLGQGGMGVVYAAVHQHTARAVALKLVQCAWSDQRLELYQRFLGEARTASLICHPNVVDVLDMGFVAGAPYLVMERLSGESLEETLTRLEVLPLVPTIGWLLPVMGALAALHGKGVVHRDIKPSNIFLSRDAGGRVVPKLLDFGLARVTRDAPITQSGVLLGTPEYMAPERARGQEVGPPADVWAMGIVVFECLCGKLPFTATTVHGIAAQIISGEVLRARDVNPSLPVALAAVIDRALLPAPEHRHESMAQFAYALGAAAHGAGLDIPAEPDPIGLPNFGTLLLQNDPWFSGPLAKAALAGARGRVAEPASARPPAASQPARRAPSTGARGLRALLVASLLLAVIVLVRLALVAQPARTVAPTSAPLRAIGPAASASQAAPESAGPPAAIREAPAAVTPPAPALPAEGPLRAHQRSRRGARSAAHSAAAAANSNDFEREWY